MAAVRLASGGGPERRSRPLRELSRAIDIVTARSASSGPSAGRAMDFAAAWSRPLFDRVHPFGARVQPLSPSSETQLAAIVAMGKELLVGTDKTRRTRPHQNDLSVVVWVTVGDVAMLLASDLENTRQPGMGWTAILSDAAQANLGRADMYKVAHHGSAGADDPRVWAELLVEHPPALVAPWQFPEGSANYLPQQGDVDRLCSRAGEVWITAPPPVPGVEDPYQHGGPPLVPDEVHEISYECGRVTFRRDATGPGPWWRDHQPPAYAPCH